MSSISLEAKYVSPRLSFEEVFNCLLNREELEYALEDDEQPYRARPMSRWDHPIMVMVFASTLRSLLMLRTSKLGILTGKTSETFAQDLQAIVDAKPEDFERALSFDKHGGAKTLVEVFTSKDFKQTNPKVHAALKHLLLQTAVVPLTEGNKMKMRHMSFSQTLRFGALKLFMTCNFADSYSPLVLKLYSASDRCGGGDGDALDGEASVNLFEDAPRMPSLQAMHRLLAKHPTLQARLFLLMEQLTITELLCGSGAFIGRESLESLDAPPLHSYASREDCYASDGFPGLANFMTSLVEPLESQGRGFQHGHKKINGVPSCRASVLKDMFRGDDGQLRAFLSRLRSAVLLAASTIQYDSAAVPAAQLGVDVAPEPFSKKQQLQTRFDGGVEVDGETIRPLLDVTEREPPGHVAREKVAAELELRPHCISTSPK